MISICLVAIASAVSTPAIVPQPVTAEFREGRFVLTEETVIIAPDSLKSEATALRDQLAAATDMKLTIQQQPRPDGPQILLALDESLKKLGAEGYTLDVVARGAVIRSSAAPGVFHGIQSLLQLLLPEHPTKWEIPCVSINDRPRFAWRGFMLDEARHFRGEEEVKKLLDEMAPLKMNVFHWHLTDDQGWRVEIKKYPRLTEVGGRRADTQVGGWASKRRAGEPHEGFYTQEQIRRIVAYAAARHINIVPEIGMPGHAAAAIAAYPELGTLKKDVPVMDHFDEAVDIYDPSSPRVYEILGEILDEVVTMFPGSIIHMGGDEVHFTHWKNSKSIAEMMKREKLASMADVQLYFTNRIARMITERGKIPMGWNEIYGKNVHQALRDGDNTTAGKLDSKTIIQFWMGNPGLATTVIRDGYRVVNSWNQYTYLNQAYARIPLGKAYSFEPMFSDLTTEEESQMLGVGCQMWGEWAPSVRELEYYIFPRIAAIAEVAWSPKGSRDFASFQQRLQPMLARWECLGIHMGRGQIDPPSLVNFAEAPVIGKWSPEIISTDWKDVEWSVEKENKVTGELHVAFRHTGGANAIDIERVDLLMDGKIVASDLHAGSAGGQPRDPIYSLIAPPSDGRSLVIRAKIKGVGGANSNGAVLLIKGAEHSRNLTK